MHKKWLAWSLVPGLLIGLSGCPDVEKDTGEGVAHPTVEFDPSNSIVPFPNNLVLSPDGAHVALPMQCNESIATTVIRNGVLNKLDGFGTYELAMQVTFSDDVDPATLNDQTVVLYKRASGLAGQTDAPSAAIPVIVIPGMTLQYPQSAPDCGTPVMKMNATIVPRVPLDETSFYTAAVLKGVKTTTGEDYTASFTWSLVRSAQNPVVLDDNGNVTVNRTPLNPTDAAQYEQLKGINLLWNAHAKALAFLESKGHQRSDILVAWEFRTQTTTDPLDPSVPNSPAAAVPSTPLTAVVSLTDNLNRNAPPFVLCDPAGGGPGGDTNAVCFLKISLGAAAGATGAAIYPTGNALCAAAGCAAVGNVVSGILTSAQYQAEVQNAFDVTKPIPGQWNDPVHPTKVKDEAIQLFGFLPAAPPPAGGYKFVVFGHGLGSTKKSLIAIAPSFAAAGFASIGIDFVAHDSRAVRTSNNAALGCADNGATPPDPTQFPQCYAQFLSADLGADRDNFRQSVLDVQGLIKGLKACGTTMCNSGPAHTVPAFQVDAAHVSYTGISLGGILGSIITATSDVKASVLNVPGAGWLDILENTATKQISCTLVDALIGAGVLVGDKSNAPLYTTGLCTTDAWKDQPGYKTFSAIGRWVLDPADPANFTQMLAMKRILIQEVVGDLTVPNIATNNEGALVGLAAGVGDCGVPNPSPPPFMLPSAAIVSMPMMNKFLKYTSVPPGTSGCTPGNDFAHPSLLRPEPGRCSTAPTTRCQVDAQCGGGGATCIPTGRLATARLQTDAITFLLSNQN